MVDGRRCSLVSLLLLGVVLAGCAGRQTADRAAIETDAPAITSDRVPTLGAPFESGLEVVRWTTDDTDARVGSVLAPFAERWALPEGSREAWEQAGFRLLIVREEELHGVMQGLPPVRSLNREWLGNRIQWKSLRTSPRGLTSVLLDDERLNVSRDVLRLLVRSWVTPTPDGARVRVDLCVVRSEEGRRTFFTETPDARVLDDASGAELLGNLRAELELEAGELVLIIGERPGVVWRAPVAQAGDDDGFFERPTNSNRERGNAGYGPGVVRIPTIGEAMLMREDDRMGEVRSLIVLVARAPEEFELLPSR